MTYTMITIRNKSTRKSIKTNTAYKYLELSKAYIFLLLFLSFYFVLFFISYFRTEFLLIVSVADRLILGQDIVQFIVQLRVSGAL